MDKLNVTFIDEAEAPVETDSFVYAGVPKDVTTKKSDDIIFTGRLGSPFVEEINRLEETVQEVRGGISRFLDTWIRVQDTAFNNQDDLVYNRATNEIAGLHKLLERLQRATT